MLAVPLGVPSGEMPIGLIAAVLAVAFRDVGRAHNGEELCGVFERMHGRVPHVCVRAATLGQPCRVVKCVTSQFEIPIFFNIL